MTSLKASCVHSECTLYCTLYCTVCTLYCVHRAYTVHVLCTELYRMYTVPIVYTGHVHVHYTVLYSMYTVLCIQCMYMYTAQYCTLYGTVCALYCICHGINYHLGKSLMENS